MSGFTSEEAEALVPAAPQGEAATSVMSQGEAAAAVMSLTPGQKVALFKVARLYATRTVYSCEDLIQETYSRVLAGDRKWHLTAVAFLSGVMRSIAWEWKGCDNSPVEVELSDEGVEARGVIARLDVQRVFSLFDDDPVIGAAAEAIQASCGLSQTEYESKRKKIRRRIEKLQLP